MTYPAMTDVEKSVFASTYAARYRYFFDLKQEIVRRNSLAENNYDPLVGPLRLDTPWTDTVSYPSENAWLIISAVNDAYGAVEDLRAQASAYVTSQGVDTDGRGAYLAELVNIPE